MMPNPWKRRSSRISSLSRLLSSLRPKRPSPDSPLLVQTGFPTSLADLIVKHRSRLRKKKSTLNHNPPSFTSRVSDIISVVDASENHLNHRHHQERRRQQGLAQLEYLDDGSTQIVESTHSPEIEAPQNDATAPREDEGSNLCPTRGLNTQTKIVLVMVLAVCTRELVLGVMLSAFLLLLVEFLGGRVLGWTRRSEENKEVIEHLPSIGLEKRELPNWGFHRCEAASPETSDLGKVVSLKAKRRQLAKIIMDKFRHLKRGKDSKESVREEGQDEGEEVVVVEGECERDGEAIGKVEKKWKSKGSPWIHPLLLLVVLSGLLGGKVVATAITVICCYLIRMREFLATKRRGRRSRIA